MIYITVKENWITILSEAKLKTDTWNHKSDNNG